MGESGNRGFPGTNTYPRTGARAQTDGGGKRSRDGKLVLSPSWILWLLQGSHNRLKPTIPIGIQKFEKANLLWNNALQIQPQRIPTN